MQNEAEVLNSMTAPGIGEQGAVPEAPKDKPKDTKSEKDLLESMMFSPSASDADPTLSLDTTTDVEDKSKDAKELLKILEKGEGKMSKKYQKELLDKALKDPSSVEVETPRGWMTVREAIEQGFDMSTGEFSNSEIPTPDWEGSISQLDPREQETIRRLTKQDSKQAGPSPVLPEGEPMEEPMGENVPTEGLESMIPGGLEGGM